MVGYNDSSYTLSEAKGYVEVCVNATSPGTATEFNISSTATENITSKYAFYITWRQAVPLKLRAL